MKPAALLLILSIHFLLGFCSTVNAEPNLISWWKFDEGIGETAYDSAGSNDGTLVDGPVWTTGRIGGALSFDGSDDYVALSSFTTVSTDNGTVSLWFKTSADFSENYGGQGNLISRDSQYYGYMAVTGNGTVPYGIYGETNPNNDYFVGVGDAAPVDAWNHIAVSFYYKTAKTYLNGQLIDTKSVTGPSLSLSRIGGRTSVFFNGQIDDVRIYDGALSADEVKELYRYGTQKAFAPIPNNGATDVDLDVVLNWSAGKDAASHDVYFGTDYNDVNDADTLLPEYKGNFDVNNYDPCGLEISTIYYWRIDEVNDSNLWKGNVWNFTVISGKAKNPQPSDGQHGVRENAVLSWSPGIYAASHDVYFGTDFNDVNDGGAGSPEYKGNFDVNSYDPCGLEIDTIYFWRIDEVNDPNLWKGDVWSFGTMCDFGDLPDGYKTLLASDGPRHPAIGPMLGANRDTEWDGVPGPDARGDDLAGVDDEDGMQFWGGSGVRVTVSAACKLNAWVDWNNDGDFADTDERVFTNQSLTAGAKSFVMTVPAGVATDTYLKSRWRVTTANMAADITASYGAADDGEVEDYNKPYVSSCYGSGDPCYSDWVEIGRPYCWCYPRQCHGDADGRTPQTKPPYQWVTNDDLIILKSGWSKHVDKVAGTDICADFNRKPFGKSRWWVSGDDLVILKANWMIANKPDPNCVPGNRTPDTAPPME